MSALKAPLKLALGPWLLAGLLVSLGLTVLAIWWIDPRYAFNDDMIIASILSGDYTGTPDPRSIYGGAAVSVVIAWLSGFWSSVPWFLAICTFCNIFLALLVGFYLIERLRSRGPAYLLIALPLFVVQTALMIWVLLLPTYSAAATAAAASSLIVVFLYLQSNRTDSWLLVLAISTFFFALGWGIREGGFPLVGVFFGAAPAVAFLLWRLGWPRSVFLVTAWVFFVGIDRLVKLWIYSSPAWQESLAVIDRMNTIWSGYVFGSIIPIGLAQGWTGAEVGLVQYLSPVPSANFSLSSLESFLSAAQVTTIGSWAIAPPTFETALNSFFTNRHAFIVVGFTTAAITFYLLTSGQRRAQAWLLLVTSVASVSAVILFLSFIRNNTGHVTLPLAVAAMTLSAIAITLETDDNRAKVTPKVAVSLVVVASAGFLFLTWNLPFGAGASLSGLTAKNDSWKAQVEDFKKLDPGCLVIGVNLGAENVPARNISELYATYPVVQLTWNSLSPLTQARLQMLGVKSWPSLFDSDSCVYFVGGVEHAEMIAEVARSSYGVTGGFQQVPNNDVFSSNVLQWQPR